MFGHFSEAFLHPLRIAQRLPIAFEHFPAAFLYPFNNAQWLFNSFKSISWRLSVKMWQFPSFSLKGRVFVNISENSKEHLKILKTTSGSSPRADLSNNLTFSSSQFHETGPLKVNNCWMGTRNLKTNFSPLGKKLVCNKLTI
jgi:hypothetical protein